MKKNGNATKTNGANRIAAVVKDAPSSAEPEVAETSSEDTGDENSNGNGDDGDTKKDKKKKATESAGADITKYRAELHDEIKKLALPSFKHGTLSTYPNLNGRSILMKKEDKGRGVNYEIEAVCQTAHTVSVTALKIITNNYVLTDDREETRASTYMDHNHLTGGSLMLRHNIIDVNGAEANARRALEALHGTTNPAEASATAAAWIKDKILDLYSSEPRGNKNTALGGIPPVTVLVEFTHAQPANLMGAFETPVQPENGLSESEVATVRLVRECLVTEKAILKARTKLLESRGVTYQRRVVVYSKSQSAEKLVLDAGVSEPKNVLVEDIDTLCDKVAKWVEETRGAGGENPLPRWVSIHMLKPTAATNENRDSDGRPKRTTYGGVPRKMWTSQAENAGCRAAEAVRIGTGTEPVSLRTTKIADEILVKLGKLGKDAHAPEAKEIVGGFVNFAWGPVRTIEKPVEEPDDWRTKNGYFPASDEIDRAANVLTANWTALLPVAKKVAGQIKERMEALATELASAK